MSGPYRVAVVGATGVVGQTVLRVLHKHSERFPVGELVPFASPHSEGKLVQFGTQRIPCRVLTQDATDGFDLVFSSAGADISREWAKEFAAHGAIVIDKSSAFRKDDRVPLVVPEVNPDDVEKAVGPDGLRIIATPNCSTTQLVVTLAPLRKAAEIRRLVIATYQAVSGTGARALEELDAQAKASVDREEMPPPKLYPHQIAFNALAQAGSFVSDAEGRTDEEEKLRQETCKILHRKIPISATCVRVPVRTCHSEAVNIEFSEPVSPELARELLEAAAGITVLDNPSENLYPTAIQAADQDQVFVGRIRRDPGHERALDLWIVADNLRKGAATNAVQIAELLHEKDLLNEKIDFIEHEAAVSPREPTHA
jgi:aspartate-semialdehyde dehydrogenase